MIQDIIAYLIISFAFGILLIRILRFFNLAGKKTANNSKCGGCTSGCEMKERHAFNKNKPTNYDQFRLQL